MSSETKTTQKNKNILAPHSIQDMVEIKSTSLKPIRALCIPCIPSKLQDVNIKSVMKRLNLGLIEHIHVSSENKYGIKSAFIFYSQWNTDTKSRHILQVLKASKYIYVYSKFPYYFKCCFLDPDYDVKRRLHYKNEHKIKHKDKSNRIINSNTNTSIYNDIREPACKDNTIRKSQTISNHVETTSITGT